MYLSPCDIVQPDILFIAAARLGIIEETYIRGAPDLLVEVLSPSNPERDRDLKRKLYARFGVREYWIADPDAHSVELSSRREGDLVTLKTFVVDDHLESRLLEGFELFLPGIFKPFR